MPGRTQLVAHAVRPQALRAWSRRQAAVRALVFASAGVLLFLAYLSESRTLPVNSDGAGNALEAWDMLHGNLLLHGWLLTDVSFYTTELPQYMLVELARGLGSDVVHVAAAMTYTLLVLLTALLARGRATGREAAARMLLAAGIMLVPTLGVDANVLLLSPDHTGTMVPLLITWLILDRAGHRWYVPVLAGLILTLAAVADTVTLLEGAAPVILVCLLRLLRDRRSGPPRRFELALAGSTAAAAVVARLAVSLIHRGGGFLVHPVTSPFGTFGTFGQRAVNTAKGLLVLFGSDFFGGASEPNAGFFGHYRQPSVAIGALHLIGVAVAVWAVCVAVRRCYREPDLVLTGLTVAVLVLIGAYLFSGFSANFLNLREMAGVLPMTAVLAGRLLPDRLAAWLRGRTLAANGQAGPGSAGGQASPGDGGPGDGGPGDGEPGDGGRRGRPVIRRLGTAGLVTVLLAAGACYGANLAYNATRPPVPAQYQLVASWLARHHLSYGLGGYWQADSITLATGSRISVRAVYLADGQAAPGQWETQRAWYDPRRHNADFAVLSPGRGGLQLAAVTAAFGRPAHVYHVAGCAVLTWHENLLTDVASSPAQTN